MSETKQQGKDCPCRYPCQRHGQCDQCRAYHKYDQTACQKAADKTKTPNSGW